MPARTALTRAAELGFDSVELWAAGGELSPVALSASGRRHVRRFVEGLRLGLAALSADLPHLRLTDAAAVDERISRTTAVLDLAVDLHVRVVTCGMGALTHPTTEELSACAIEALRRLGACADARGVVLALRPEQEGGDRLLAVLEALRCPSIGVCLDPAAILMSGGNPTARLERYVDQVTLVHVRDARTAREGHGGCETTLGEGDLDWLQPLAMLEAADYRGAYILRRRDSADAPSAVAQGRERLLRLLAET